MGDTDLDFTIVVDDSPLAQARAAAYAVHEQALRDGAAMRLPDYTLVVLQALRDQGDARLGELDFLGRTVSRIKQILDHFDEELQRDYEAFFCVKVGVQVTAAAVALEIWRGNRDFAITLLDAMLNACIECHTAHGRMNLMQVGTIAIRQLQCFGVLRAAI